jgi:hypothetical protein
MTDDATRDRVVELQERAAAQLEGVRLDLADVKAHLQRLGRTVLGLEQGLVDAEVVRLPRRLDRGGKRRPDARGAVAEGRAGSWPARRRHGRGAGVPPASTTRPVTARRISARVTSCLPWRSASAATIARRLRGTPSASSSRIAGATRATMASVSAEDG